MKTIKELAEEFEISRQGLSKRIETMNFKGSLVKTKNGLSVPDDIEYELRAYYLKQNLHSDNKNQSQSTKSNPELRIEQSEETLKNQKQPNEEECETKYNELKQLYEIVLNQKQAAENELNEIKQRMLVLERENELLKEQIVELKSDKSDLQKHRDNLTAALTVSKSDLARLENIITKMAAMPLRTRVFGWSGAVAQLTTESEETVIEIDDVQENIK